MNEIIDNRVNILDSDPDDFAGIVSGYGEKKFRGAQLLGWLARGVRSFEEMRNLPGTLRASLAQDYIIDIPNVVLEQRSRKDDTRKCLLRFRDGSRVEAVFMKYQYGNSVCISSQVGCRMGCKFCASTRKGLERSLTSGEMFGEILAMRNLTGEEIRHVVVMGIGEPFDNYDQLSRFLRMIHTPGGYALSMRNVTVSTCGRIPEILRFAEDFPQANLAVSLHAPNGDIRRRSMPVERKYPYDELMRACREYTRISGRRITFEYALIHGVNDHPDDARELAGRLRGWQTHVNLIPLNRVDGTGYTSSGKADVERFRRILQEEHIAVTVRRTLGSEIDAACGQLRLR